MVRETYLRTDKDANLLIKAFSAVRLRGLMKM